MASQVVPGSFPAPLKDLYRLLNAADKKVTLGGTEMGRYKAIALTVTRLAVAAITLSALASGVAITPPLIVAVAITSGPGAVIAFGSYATYTGIALMAGAIATLALPQFALGLAAAIIGYSCMQQYAVCKLIDIGEIPAECVETTTV